MTDYSAFDQIVSEASVMYVDENLYAHVHEMRAFICSSFLLYFTIPYGILLLWFNHILLDISTSLDIVLYCRYCYFYQRILLAAFNRIFEIID